MFDRGAGTRRRICGAKCRDYQKLDALFLISLIPTHDQDRCAGAATAGRISEVARRDTAKYLPRLQPSPRARLSLGSATIRFAAARHALVEIILRLSPASLCTPGGGIARFARRIGNVSQGLALPRDFDGDRYRPV